MIDQDRPQNADEQDRREHFTGFGSSAQRPPGPSTPTGRASGRRPATGRSFVVIVIVASAVSIGVALWTLHSITNGRGTRDTPASFRL